jgi:hypothetical protein
MTIFAKIARQAVRATAFKHRNLRDFVTGLGLHGAALDKCGPL